MKSNKKDENTVKKPAMKSKLNLSKFSVLVYWLILLVLLVMFFTNDFGLVDIHKTSIITAVVIDSDDDGEVLVTAEIAVPQPSQSGENIKYTQVQGSGLTIADALNEINAKTGFYPKLQFCKLILIGESCRGKQLFRMLGCFYRKNYSELTALTAMCEGNAYDMLALKSNVSNMTSEAIRKVLSDEIEKSANATSANLKKIAAMQYSQSAACFMPYVEVNKPGESENGGNGDNVGGEGSNSGQQGGGGGQGGSGGSGQGQGGGESGGGGQGQGGESPQSGSGGSEQPVEFSARKTAYFSDGNFVGILDEQQAFALAVISNNIRIAVLPCDADDIHYTLGLRNVKCGVDLKVENGVPVLSVKFSARAQIQGARVKVDLQKIIADDAIPASVTKGAETEVRARFEDLLKAVKESGADIIGVKQLLYKKNYKYYDAFKDDILQRMRVDYKIKITSVS